MKSSINVYLIADLTSSIAALNVLNRSIVKIKAKEMTQSNQKSSVGMKQNSVSLAATVL